MKRLDQPESAPLTTPMNALPRLFIHEPGWSVERKMGSERAHCHSAAPGDDAYHRLSDGEIFLVRGDEKLCLACADRLGLLTHAPKALKTPARGRDVGGSVEPGGYDLSPRVGNTEA